MSEEKQASHNAALFSQPEKAGSLGSKKHRKRCKPEK
jgi:hypothetical protein